MDATKQKTFLMIYSILQTGGIETLIVRMANWLVGNGHKVKLLLNRKSDLDHLLDGRIQVKYYGYKYHLFHEPFLNRILVGNSFFSGIDVIYTFQAETCWLAGLIHKNLKNKPVFLTGVYSFGSFSPPEKSNNPFEIFFQKMIREMLPMSSILFMNTACLRDVEKNQQIKFDQARIFPLPVNIRPLASTGSRKPLPCKIVSIGRIVHFKTYNFHMLDVISKLKDTNKNVVYEIYGYGHLEQELMEKIAKLNIQEQVHFKGKLNYEDMPSVFSDAFLFVGMGTSLLEASMCGVPSLVATVCNPKATCQGFLHNRSDFNVGEIDESAEEIPLEEIIRETFSWPKERYLSECEKASTYTNKFHIDKVMKKFLDFSKQDSGKALNYLSNRTYYSYFFKYTAIIIRRLTTRLIGRG